MPNRQVAVGIDDGQVHLSRAEQGKQRTPESSLAAWYSRAEDRSNDGKPDGFHHRTNFSSEWSGDTLCTATKHYTLWNFTLLSVGVVAPKARQKLAEIRIFKTVLEQVLRIIFLTLIPKKINNESDTESSLFVSLSENFQNLILESFNFLENNGNKLVDFIEKSLNKFL